MQQGIPLVQIIFFQTLVSSAILGVFARKEIFNEKPSGKIFVVHFIRSIFWFGATLLFLDSLNHIALPKAMAISFSTPLFTIILAIIFLKEIMRKSYLISLFLGIIGMLLIVRPGFSDYEPESLFVIIASFMWAITDIIIKRLGKVKGNANISWYFLAISCIISLPLLPFYWVDMNISQVGLMLLIGIFFTFSLTAITQAYILGDMTIIQPFKFSSLIFVAIFAYFAFDEIVTLPTIIGSIVIIVSTSYIAYNERKIHKQGLSYQVAKEVIK